VYISFSRRRKRRRCRKRCCRRHCCLLLAAAAGVNGISCPDGALPHQELKKCNILSQQLAGDFFCLRYVYFSFYYWVSV
jgi:hypothetical protein